MLRKVTVLGVGGGGIGGNVFPQTCPGISSLGKLMPSAEGARVFNYVSYNLSVKPKGMLLIRDMAVKLLGHKHSMPGI